MNKKPKQTNDSSKKSLLLNWRMNVSVEFLFWVTFSELCSFILLEMFPGSG